jgi:hypothetical protein
MRLSERSACNAVEGNSSASQSALLRPLPTTDKLRHCRLSCGSKKICQKKEKRRKKKKDARHSVID